MHQEGSDQKQQAGHKETAGHKGNASKYESFSQYAVSSFMDFLHSFTPKKTGIQFFHVFFLELVLVALLLGMMLAYGQFSERMTGGELPDLSAIGEQETVQIQAQLERAYAAAIWMPIIFFFIFVPLFALLQGVGWRLIAGKKFTADFYWRFLLLNLAWLGIWSGIFVLIIYLSATSLAAHPLAATIILLVAVLLFLHLTAALFAFFSSQASPSLHSVWSSLSMAFSRFHYFLLPYLLIILVSQALRIVDWGIRLLPETAYVLLALTVLLLLVAWSKFYVYSVVEGISRMK